MIPARIAVATITDVRCLYVNSTAGEQFAGMKRAGLMLPP